MAINRNGDIVPALSEWKKLINFAKLTADRNPHLLPEIRRGDFKPYFALSEFIDKITPIIIEEKKKKPIQLSLF